MDFNSYIQLYERTIHENHPDSSRTLKGFQKRAAVTREALKMAREKYEADLAKLRDTYSDRVFQERRKGLDEEYQGLVKIAQKRIADDYEEIIAGKVEQFDRANDAPSESQVRLLQTLAMRSSLTQSELMDFAGKLSDNLPALRTLGDIARRNGLEFPANVGDSETVKKAFDDSQAFIDRVMPGLTIADNALPFESRCFWLYANQRTVADSFFDRLDANYFTSVQEGSIAPKQFETLAPDAPKAEGKAPVKSSFNAVKIGCRGDESLIAIASQFGISTSEIRKANTDSGVNLDAIKARDVIIVPAGKLTISYAKGAIWPEQCIPCHYAPPAPPPVEGSTVSVSEM